jgi:4,5-dihydroxyphthalate decarboxylase
MAYFGQAEKIPRHNGLGRDSPSMTRLPLTIACWDYDRTRGLMDGRVGVEGCEVTYLPLSPEEVFFRAFRHHEFDVTELSFSTYMMTRLRGTCPYIAIPAFVSRSFRHSAIFIRTDRGISKPEDLKGRLVGVPEYQVTAALWVRGMLKDEYGVDPADIDWRSGGIEEPGRHEKADLKLPPGVRLSAVAPGQTLSGLLASGEIDALVTPRAPSCFTRGMPHIGRLFPDYRAAEQAYWKKTGIFPIMHIIGIRESLVERNPWLPSSVFKAFIQAKALAQPELHQIAALKTMLPWVVAEAEQTERLMGTDFWPYGVEPNLPTLEAITRYSFEQGMIGRKVTYDELFAPSTRERFKV